MNKLPDKELIKEISLETGIDSAFIEKAVRRMLDLDQHTKIDTIFEALKNVFAYRLVMSMEQVA